MNQLFRLIQSIPSAKTEPFKMWLGMRVKPAMTGEAEIVYAVRTQLSWTHIRSLLSIDNELKRVF